MPKKRKAPHSAWKTGQTGNPNGRPKLAPDIKKSREINQIEFERIVNKYLFLSQEGLRHRLNDKRRPAIEKLIGSIIEKAIFEGDVRRAEWIMTRMLGKPTERLEVTSQRESRNLHVSIVSGTQGSLPTPEELELASPHQVMAQLEAAQQHIDNQRGALPVEIRVAHSSEKPVEDIDCD